MEFEDFKRNYSRVEICNMTPDSLTDGTKRHWEVNMFQGSWTRGSTAGGCRNYIGETEIFFFFFFFYETETLCQMYLEILDF